MYSITLAPFNSKTRNAFLFWACLSFLPLHNIHFVFHFHIFSIVFLMQILMRVNLCLYKYLFYNVPECWSSSLFVAFFVKQYLLLLYNISWIHFLIFIMSFHLVLWSIKVNGSNPFMLPYAFSLSVFIFLSFSPSFLFTLEVHINLRLFCVTDALRISLKPHGVGSFISN